jgi:hypothetical protein
MSDACRAYAELCAAAANALAAVPAAHRPEILVGFDGFIDDIIDLIDKRTSPKDYIRIETISGFGNKVLAAAGKSAGIGAVTRMTKLGGNGPIMAYALCAQDAQVTAIGVLGEPHILPVFQQLVTSAKQTITLGNPAVTSALEFADGKIMLNFSEPLNAITFDHVAARCGGVNGLKDMCRRAAGIATVNWAQVPGLTDLWHRFATEILPGLRPDRPLWFVDLADPHRCPAEQICNGIDALKEIQKYADVVLGLNENECRQMCEIFGIPYPTIKPEHEAAREACVALRKHFGFSRVMCHLVKSSAVAWDGGSAAADGFWEPKPKITTGAGDHYNAGFFGALLAGMAPAHCLQIGGATSGHYVRTGDSPTRAQVVSFLRAASPVAARA